MLRGDPAPDRHLIELNKESKNNRNNILKTLFPSLHFAPVPIRIKSKGLPRPSSKYVFQYGFFHSSLKPTFVCCHSTLLRNLLSFSTASLPCRFRFYSILPYCSIVHTLLCYALPLLFPSKSRDVTRFFPFLTSQEKKHLPRSLAPALSSQLCRCCVELDDTSSGAESGS